MPLSDVLLEDPRIRKLTFTGSTEVGRMLYARAARTLKRVSLELGGNAPFLVFEDADIELAAKEVATSKFRNAGQTCICTNRILVDEAVRAPFTEAFADIAALAQGRRSPGRGHEDRPAGGRAGRWPR